MNLSFAGCGFLGIYHVGVAVCFKKYAPHLLLDKISGASAGCLAATCLLCDMPLGEMTSDFFRVVNEARSHSLGPFSPSFNIQTCLLEGLQKFLPPDAHKRVSGRLHISLTRSYDGKNIIVSQFNSREELLQALLCACFIPGFSGILPPRFQGIRYMDGAFSDNLPVLDENTVTVSPFCGESDICPRDQSAQLFHVNWANTSIELSRQNINRFVRILFPPKPEVLSNMCQQGFDDALQFLHRNNLISCTRCLAVQSTFVVQEAIPEAQEYDPECIECQKHRKDALIGDMPETVLTVFQTYIESANKGLANWMFRHKGAKLLQALSLPATVPADFVYASLTKIMSAAPCIGNQFWSLSKYFLGQFNAIIKSRNNQKVTPNLSCQLSLSELNGKQKNKHILSHRSSKVDVFINPENSVTTPKDLPLASDNTTIMNEVDALIANTLTSTTTQGEVDTFDHILEVTSQHEAVYAYYYMDENNKVKVTEIFDMTNSEDPTIQTLSEQETNQQLQFDTDWNATPATDCMYGGIPECHKHHRSHYTHMNFNNNNNSNKNNNNISNYNNNKLSISDEHPMTEDELENIFNQSLTEQWQQQQSSSSSSSSCHSTNEQIDNEIDIDSNQSTLISEKATKALSRTFSQTLY